MAKPGIIVPSILAKTKKDALRRLKLAAAAKKVQVDIIDGRFAPNKTVMPRDFWDVKTKLALEFQLMVEHPEHYVHDVAKIAQARLFIFHVESLHNKRQALALIEHCRFHGLAVGIALNPKTPAARIKPYLKLVDHVLVMTVKPGFMGQAFMDMTKKIKQIRRWSKDVDIEVDGGIHHSTALNCRFAGANLFVVGSALFDAPDFKREYAALTAEVNRV
ncbi:ribulose-phosphate 3-epimerase [Candidatus Woesearchaeota archaeon]|nr:ribulose-phosphate 3-epimerase [Candidatus Woesearchaeota archaeon]